MARTMKAVDAVMVGMGWSGSIMARELTKAGLSVVGLERGADRSPREDFTLPRVRDELKYRLRLELMLDTAVETHTFRNSPSELAQQQNGKVRNAETVTIAGRRARRYDIDYTHDGKQLVERLAFVLREKTEYLLLCRYEDGGSTDACDRLLATFTLD